MAQMMTLQDFGHKVKSKLFFTFLKSKLKLRGLSGRPPVIDYGWIKLPYSNDGDWQELYYHAYQRQYYQHELSMMQPYIKPGDCVIDIGANLGFMTAILASLVGSEGKVYSFEPLEATYQKLLKTVSVNGLSMVEPIKLGLGEQDASQALYRVTGSSGNDTLVGNADGNVAVGQVEITSLDAYLANNTRPITFIKIDTEGYELQVLRGAIETLKKYRPVILIELCAEYLESSLESVKLLERLGYQFPAAPDVSRTSNGSNFIALPTPVTFNTPMPRLMPRRASPPYGRKA